MAEDTTPNWYRANQEYLVAELAELKARFQARDSAGAAAARVAGGAGATLGESSAFLERPPALESLARAFGLSEFERHLLLLCAAPELDQDFTELYAAAQGDPARGRPTFGLAFAILEGAHWSALAPDGRLRHWRLIELSSGAMLTSAALQIDERILHFLLGVDHLDERLAHLVRVVSVTQKRQLAPSHAQIASDIAAHWSSHTPLRDMPMVQLCGDADDCLPIIAAAAHECGTQVALLNAGHAPESGIELDAFLKLWAREALLSDLGVLVIQREEFAHGGAEDRRLPLSGFSPLLERVTGRTVLLGRQRTTLEKRSALTIEVKHPAATEQRLVWCSALRLPAEVRIGEPAPNGSALSNVSAGPNGGTPPNGSAAPNGNSRSGIDDGLDALVAQFDLSVRVIRAVAADAASRAGEGALEAAWNVCRMFLRDRMEGLAHRIETHAGWADLVLPAAEIDVLRAIVAQVRQRRTVYETWGFAHKSGRGLGTSVLFSGPSGTGKTLAAEVLANEMRLDLYRIDLSSVVSKYIGESEKALRRVFDAAEDSGAILLFDEADALFGLRSPVKDSHDRYANIQVSYLLQRMELYRGLAILTTNQKYALDPAFMRRLRFVVQFPFPDLVQRTAIWNAVFPKSAPLDGLNMERLAQLRVAGGNIRNIAMNAAFLAAEERRAIHMQDVLVATRAEYAKLERSLTAAETAGW